MTWDPPSEFDQPAEELSPAEVHDRWESVTNLQADDLRGLRELPEHEAYLAAASEGREESDPPIEGGPLEDALHLATTPREDWGADEKAEAAEALDWEARHRPQFDPEEGDDLTPGDGTKTTKADVAGWRWGFDWRTGDDLP